MIDFATLQGLAIPEGVVTQIDDAAGNVLWKLSASDEPAAILEVTKVTKTTYAGETQYANETFVLLDIYPKKNGTVKVTYGGLTKTIKDTSGVDEPNAIQVFFGTFNGVTDSVTTPASGTVTIEGAYRGYGRGYYQAYANKEPSLTADCITGAIDMGRPAYIGNYTFNGCTNLVLNSLPESLITIGDYAFRSCYNVNARDFPPNLVSIGKEAFYMDSSLDSDITSHAMYNATITLPNTIQSIGDDAFRTNKQYLAGEYKYYTYIAGVKIHATTPPTIGEDTFGTGGMSHGLKAKITASVPTGCGEAYKAAQYWSLLNIVEGV